MGQGGHHITTAGEVFKKERIVSKRARIARCEEHHRMTASRNGSVPTTVGFDLGKRGPHQLRNIVPHSGRCVFSCFAPLAQRSRIPEANRQLSLVTIQKRIAAFGVNELHHSSSNRAGTSWLGGCYRGLC